VRHRACTLLVKGTPKPSLFTFQEDIGVFSLPSFNHLLLFFSRSSPILGVLVSIEIFSFQVTSFLSAVVQFDRFVLYCSAVFEHLRGFVNRLPLLRVDLHPCSSAPLPRGFRLLGGGSIFLASCPEALSTFLFATFLFLFSGSVTLVVLQPDVLSISHNTCVPLVASHR